MKADMSVINFYHRIYEYEPSQEHKDMEHNLYAICEINEFKPIKGWEGEYDINPRGEVYSHKSNKILKPIVNSNGYFVVNLKRGRYYVEQHFIHRLVAEAFIPNPHNYPVINHIDEDKTNNWATNLEWCTVQYNNNYGSRTERMSDSQSIPIIGIDPEGKEHWYPNQYTAEFMTGTCQANIWKVLHKQRRKAGGWRWHFEDEYEMYKDPPTWTNDYERSREYDVLMEEHGGSDDPLPDWYISEDSEEGISYRADIEAMERDW